MSRFRVAGVLALVLGGGGGAASVLAAARPAHAQQVSGLDPHVHVVATANPAPRIRLEWAAVPNTASFTVLRRDSGADRFEMVTGGMLPGDATSFEDAMVERGRTYEYTVRRTPSIAPTAPLGNAYVIAGIEVPFRDDQGVVVLVIDQTMAPALAMELDRLEADLVADGWTVVRELVAPTATPPMVHARIEAAAMAHGTRLRAVFLLGGVPRAFSGVINPDGHPDHRGAWPADGYYGDVDGMWTDTGARGGTGGVAPFTNEVGDGKFDQSLYPSEIELAVGRVDTVDMPAFTGLDATALLRRYLDKDHAFRTGTLDVRRRTFVSDNFGFFSGEAFARAAFRDGVATFGSEPESGRPFFDALEDPMGGYALAFGCGGGDPTGAGGVGTTADFVSRMPRAVFVPLFGSYFGDWSYSNDFLRAAILARGATLASTWFARPWGHYHALGAMQSLGDAFLATQNNVNGDYDTGFAVGMVHQALLGDPTIRLFVTRAPSGLTATPGANGVALRWSASSSMVAGYHVYRAAMGAPPAPAERLTMAPVTATEYLDATAAAGTRYAYRVVAVELITTGSGSFYNHSPGAIVEATGAPRGAAPDGGASGDGGTNGGDGGARGDGGTGGADGGTGGRMASGCGCRAAGGGERGRSVAGWGVLLAGATAGGVRRRRRRRALTAP